MREPHNIARRYDGIVVVQSSIKKWGIQSRHYQHVSRRYLCDEIGICESDLEIAWVDKR